jgi:MoaA/NifB/PqqE/SkfB family radical SAM enzyme
MISEFKYKKIHIDVATQHINADGQIVIPARCLAWIERFPLLQKSIQIKCQEHTLEDAAIEDGNVYIHSPMVGINDLSIDLPYHANKSLYRDHVVLPLDVYAQNCIPSWINEQLPLHFYSALVLFGDAEIVAFDKDFDGYEDFTGYVKGNIDSRDGMQAMYWGIKALASKLPRPIAASREICFHLAHGDMSLPKQVNISPTNACNLRCTICGSQAHLDKLNIPRQFMKREVLEALAETMFPLCKTVELNSLGEPTLHKDFDYLIELINKYDCALVLQTNGTNFTNRILRTLKKTHGRISLSIDATGKIFEQQRVNASWDKVNANIIKLMSMRDRARLTVDLYPTLTQRSAVDAIQLCKWADKIGIDSIYFHYYDPIIDGIEKSPSDEEKIALEQALRDYIDRHQPTVVIELQYKRLSPQSTPNYAKLALKLNTQSLGSYMRRALRNVNAYVSRVRRKIFYMRQITKDADLGQGSVIKFPSGRWYDPNLPKVSPQQSLAHPQYVCVASLNNAVINLHGDFSVCCKTQTTMFGSCLTDDAFYASWFGERLQAMRRNFLRANPIAVLMPECKECIAKFGHID